MGLINEQEDRRPRDWAYVARFDKKDLPSLQQMIKEIQETHNIDIIEDFNLKCDQRLASKTAALEYNGLEIQSVTKTEDLVLNPGLQQCINIIIQTSAARWTHFGMSTGGAAAPTVTDTALQVETIGHRVSLAWGEAVGMKMFFGGLSSQTLGSVPGSVGEIGVYNGSAAGATLLNRSLFSSLNRPVPGSTGSAVYSAPVIVSAVIEFCPVA